MFSGWKRRLGRCFYLLWCFFIFCDIFFCFPLFLLIFIYLIKCMLEWEIKLGEVGIPPTSGAASCFVGLRLIKNQPTTAQHMATPVAINRVWSPIRVSGQKNKSATDCSRHNITSCGKILSHFNGLPTK